MNTTAAWEGWDRDYAVHYVGERRWEVLTRRCDGGGVRLVAEARNETDARLVVTALREEATR